MSIKENSVFYLSQNKTSVAGIVARVVSKKVSSPAMDEAPKSLKLL